jgi:transcriptional regulator with XRE-family HTH domain
MTPFGHFLRKVRTAKGYQLTQLALSIGISPCYLSSMENGKKGPPSQAVLDEIVRELALSCEEITELEAAKTASKKTYTLPDGLEIYQQVLASNIWRRLDSIKPEQAACIEMILKLTEEK